ncbi:restriction endonuclease subunit S [Vreelandella profundi]|uniref:restriction endonuclease subunit S n=1 Tax=Vreelandella profundi TaxID=2852117 RepID=UPI001EF13C73|nr:restriction endonuclease subunit S [Halomonas profundi]
MKTLDEVCVAIVDCEHKTAPKVESGYPSIRTTDIKNGRIDFENANRVSEETYNKWTKRRCPMPGDLILAREAPVGEVGLIPDGAFPVLGQRTVLLSPNCALVVPRYLHYLLLAPHLQHEIKVRSSGSTVHHLNMKDIRALKLPALPTLPEQREIAAVLGALDDKIELNRKMATTLEAMVRAIYRSWFVDFDPVHARTHGLKPAHMDDLTRALFPTRFGDDGLPEGWKMGVLSDIALNPRTGVKPDQIDPNTPYIGLEHMPRKSIAISNWGTAEQIGSQKSAISTGDFLFGKLRPYFHKVGVSPVDGICSTDIIVVRPKSQAWGAMVLSIISSGDFVEYTNLSSSGTRMPRTNWKDMGSYEVVLPSEPIVQVFEDVTSIMREKIIRTIYENQTLATLRDTLLPRLMSGELRVGEAREMAEDVV